MMIWRLLASVLLMATTAQAGSITKLYSNGGWDVSYNASNSKGNPMCVMAAKFAWADGANGAVYVKWTEQIGASLQVWNPVGQCPKARRCRCR